MLIYKLNNQDIDVANNIRKVFYDSYSVEAKILKAVDFPPLTRSLVEYIQTDTVFYGCHKDNLLAGVIEIRDCDNKIHIQSLVVDPLFFKQGAASKLMTFVLDNFNSEHLFVETGIDNIPAIQLYEKFGFKQVKQWLTNHGIIKVKLVKNTSFKIT